jgi:hypothetical protein
MQPIPIEVADDKINKLLSNFDWGWINDIPTFFGFRGKKSPSDNE